MRFLIGLGGVLAGLGYAVWRLFLRVDGIPPDHPSTAITSKGALAFTRKILAKSWVNRPDVALTFGPATVSSLKLMVEGRNFYPAILTDIEAASESVHINQYGFKPGKIADWFVPVLEARARAGVEVRLSLDGIGSAVNGVSKPMLTRLAAAGVQIVIHDAAPPDRTGLFPDRPVDRRNDEIGRVDHRKMYVIDGRTAWIGGAGIEDHFENGKFHDLFVRVEGDVVRQMQALFLASWRYLGGPAPDGNLARFFPAPADTGTALVHAKAIVADDTVLVGTLNLDAWALYRNPEIALRINDAGVASTFRADLFDADIAGSTAAVAPTDWMTLLKGRILNKFPSLL